MLLWDFPMFPLDNCQCSNGLWWINMLWLASTETSVMLQGKNDFSTLKSGKLHTLIHRLQSRFFSLTFLSWDVSILFRAFLRSEYQERIWVGGTLVGKSYTASEGCPTSEAQRAPEVSLHCLPRRRLFSGFPPSLAELPVLMTVYPNA